jgi:hypothetical protein
MTRPLPPPDGDWLVNPGYQPEHTRGKRIGALLWNGRLTSTEPVIATAPLGWAADKAGWTIGKPPRPFDIAYYRML